jgi:hypothetical protein
LTSANLQVLADVVDGGESLDIMPKKKAALAISSLHRRPRRNHPVLDPEVRFAVVGNAVAGPVPAVDRSVMQAQRVEFGHLASGDHADRVFLELRGQDDPEPGDVLLEDLDHRFVDPVISEVDTGLEPAGGQRFGAGIDRILEHGDPGFVPEPLAEQDRRVDAGCQQRTGNRLGDVVESEANSSAPTWK